ncbi:hypothetical protein [Vibrio parahaemolyticus]|uniref:hypothetical protein n=1 Tax=Vibrio parahaemolyticus TaxID=670 RepID=UPI003D8178E1
MSYLIRLTSDSPYLDEVCAKIDEWRKKPANRQLLSLTDDFPNLLFAPSRADNISELIGQPFYYPEYEPEVRPIDYICLDADGNVGGYLTFLESVYNGNVLRATGIRTYRFDNCTPYRFGKAQREFYDQLYDRYDLINMLFIANGDFSLGKVNIDSSEVQAATLQQVMEKRRIELGFSQPQAFKHFGERYNAVYRAYTHYGFDLDNNVRFFCSLDWLGKTGVAKGLPRPSAKVDRPSDMVAMMETYGIKGY